MPQCLLSTFKHSVYLVLATSIMRDLVDKALEYIVKQEEVALRNAMQEALDVHNIEGDLELLAKEQILTIHEYKGVDINQLLFKGKPIMEFSLTYPNEAAVGYNSIKGRQLSYKIL